MTPRGPFIDITVCSHGAIPDLCIYCNPPRERRRPSTFIPKRDLNGLAQALIEFERLPEDQKAWVRNEIERIDRGEV
jgi:hypothetical protein